MHEVEENSADESGLTNEVESKIDWDSDDNILISVLRIRQFSVQARATLYKSRDYQMLFKQFHVKTYDLNMKTKFMNFWNQECWKLFLTEEMSVRY